MNKGIHSRGYLPHWDFWKSTQAITFRLADAVPGPVIQAWRAELASTLDDCVRQQELHRRIARYEDSGHGCSILSRPDCATILQAKLIAGHPSRYCIIDWSIMPNHVNVLCRLADTSSLGDVIRSWKGASAIEINRLTGRSGHLWMADYFDRFIRDLNHCHDCRAYIRNNPVKAGLCGHPDDWPFSSAGIRWNPDGARA